MSGQHALNITGLRLHYDRFLALDGIDLAVDRGEFVALLGPSGCGKTSLLRSIAGFVHPQEGSIALGGRDVLGLAPKDRNIGLVFQNYALFPHMTVAQNVAFGLECRGVSKTEMARRVAKAIETVGLTAMAERLPKQLSGGQQQRVALARAIVIEPDILLLDEPLGALDKQLRVQMQTELRMLQKRLGIAAVFVTHDQEEAMSMADRIVVMHSGKIQQVSPPQELFNRPQTAWVSEFIGAGNLLQGQAQGGALRLAPGSHIPLPEPVPDGQTLRSFVLADKIRITPAAETQGQGFQVIGQRFLGQNVELIATYEAHRIRALITPELAQTVPVGAAINIAADATDVLVIKE